MDGSILSCDDFLQDYKLKVGLREAGSDVDPDSFEPVDPYPEPEVLNEGPLQH